MPENPVRTSQSLAALCANDGEFRIASRYWTGGLRFAFGAESAALMIEQGAISAGDPTGRPDVLTLSAPPEVWDLLLAAKPQRFETDISTLIVSGRMALDGDRVLYAQYYPAVMRAIELLRPSVEVHSTSAWQSTSLFDNCASSYRMLLMS